MMFSLAITVALIAVLFLYVRMKFQSYEVRLQLMADTIQTMAGVTRSVLQSETDDGSVESDDESIDSECDESIRYPSMEECMQPQRVTVSDDDVKHVSVPEMNEVELLPDVMKLSVSNEPELEPVTKTVALPTPFDGLTLKELKEKVAELNGPKLKSKKDLIEFLQKQTEVTVEHVEM